MRGRRATVTFEGLIDEQWAHIENVVRTVGRRRYLSAEQLDHFRTAVHRSLQRNDFELLRAFDGRSTWETYLTTVIAREFFLFQGVLWGQWRPSLVAQQLGPVAILFEKLVRCDGQMVGDAMQMMRMLHCVTEPRHRLLRMSRRLRLDESAAERSAEREHRVVGERQLAALREALKRLSPDDRLIIELRIRDQHPLHRIALILGLEVSRLTQALEHAKACIGESLLAQGIDREQVDGLLDHAGADPTHPHHKRWCAALASPAE